MSYRINNRPKPKPNRMAADVSTIAKFHITNGTLGNFAIPCWYQEIHPPHKAIIHDRHLHDHLGWPTPDRPDKCCQFFLDHDVVMHDKNATQHLRRYIDMSNLIPIHLTEEGYKSLEIAWSNKTNTPPAGVNVSCSIDPVEDWIVRIVVDANCPDAYENKVITPKFTIFAKADAIESKHYPKARDIIGIVELNIEPSGYLRSAV